MSKDKPKPRLTPEQNEARQAARAAKRERAKDTRTVAIVAAILNVATAIEKNNVSWEHIVGQAQALLSMSKGE